MRQQLASHPHQTIAHAVDHIHQVLVLCCKATRETTRCSTSRVPDWDCLLRPSGFWARQPPVPAFYSSQPVRRLHAGILWCVWFHTCHPNGRCLVTRPCPLDSMCNTQRKKRYSLVISKPLGTSFRAPFYRVVPFLSPLVDGLSTRLDHRQTSLQKLCVWAAKESHFIPKALPILICFSTAVAHG